MVLETTFGMLKKFLLPYAYLFRSALRTGTSGLYVWCAFTGMIAASKAFPPIFLAIESLIAMLAIALAVYAYNDILDIKLDKISAEIGQSHYINRPLVTGEASKLEAKIFVLAQTLVGLSIGFFINLQFLFLLVLYLALGITYSTPPIHFKQRFLLKQLVISTGFAISTLAGGAAVGAVGSIHLIYVAALFFAITFGFLPLTDLRDIYGDEKMGRKTFPIVLGPKATIKISFATTVALLLVSVLSYSWLGFNFAFLILMFAICLALSLSIFKVSKNLNNSNFIENMLNRVLQPIFLALQVSILIGLVPL